MQIEKEHEVIRCIDMHLYAYTFKRSLSAQSSAFESVTQLPAADIIQIKLMHTSDTQLSSHALARSCLTPCTASLLVPSLHSSFPQRSHRSIISLLTAGVRLTWKLDPPPAQRNGWSSPSNTQRSAALCHVISALSAV